MKASVLHMAVIAATVWATSAIAADAPHFFYINKDGNDSWFVDEVAGAKAEAEKIGAQFTSQNVDFDSNRTTVAVDTAIAAGAKGIVIVVPEQKVGPAVLKKAKDANIPMIAVDDSIKDEAGKEAPFVGFSSPDAGKQVGQVIAQNAQAVGLAKAGTRDGDHRLGGANGERLHGSDRQRHRRSQGPARHGRKAGDSSRGAGLAGQCDDDGRPRRSSPTRTSRSGSSSRATTMACSAWCGPSNRRGTRPMT